MTPPEGSQYWDGTTTGDASSSPYSSSEFAQFFYGLFGSPSTYNGLVLAPNAYSFVSTAEFGLGAGLVTGVATPVSIAAMHAFVFGRYYFNSAAQTLAIPTPGANPRIDRVALSVDWVAQTIRVVRVAGAEAATPTPPALTQTNGVTWQMSLAQVYITTGGVITVRDERPGYVGHGAGVFFRDINGRVFEEFFDNFSGLMPVVGGAISPWFATATSGTVGPAGGESAVQLNTTATNARSAQISWGNNAGVTLRGLELSKAPIIFEARMSLAAAFDNQVSNYMQIESAAGGVITFGMLGSASTTNLILQATNGGTTTFVTGQAGDATGAYHTYGIYLAASAGPAIAVYDGVAIGQVSANIPASTTDVRAMFFVGNGTTAADRVLKVDWARWVRGTN